MDIIEKNIAFCFSGQARTLDKTIEYFKKNVFKYAGSYDIFCYSSKDENSYKIDSLNPTVNITVDQSIIEQNTKSLIMTLNNLNSKKVLFTGSFKNSIEQFYKIEQANNIRIKYEKEHGYKYKYIVRLRFDQVFYDPINFLEIFSHIKKDEIIIPELEIHKNAYNDQFAIGNSETMESYCSIFSTLEKKPELLNNNFSYLDRVRLNLLYKPTKFFIDNSLSILFKNNLISKNIFDILMRYLTVLYIFPIYDIIQKYDLNNEKIWYYFIKYKGNIIIKEIPFKYFLLRPKGKNMNSCFC